MSQYVKDRFSFVAFSGYAYAPDTAKVNIITMAVNTLASGKSPRRPALEMKIFVSISKLF